MGRRSRLTPVERQLPNEPLLSRPDGSAPADRPGSASAPPSIDPSAQPGSPSDPMEVCRGRIRHQQHHPGRGRDTRRQASSSGRPDRSTRASPRARSGSSLARRRVRSRSGWPPAAASSACRPKAWRRAPTSSSSASSWGPRASASSTGWSSRSSSRRSAASCRPSSARSMSSGCTSATWRSSDSRPARPRGPAMSTSSRRSGARTASRSSSPSTNAARASTSTSSWRRRTPSGREVRASRRDRSGRASRRPRTGIASPVVIWPRLELPPAPYEKPTDRRLLEAPDGEREVIATTRKATGRLEAVLKRAGVEVATDRSHRRRGPLRAGHRDRRPAP